MAKVMSATHQRVVSSTDLVVLDKVSKHFGPLNVLKDIELAVSRGEVVVLIGPSRSGKSTLCRTINRLETIDSCTVTVDGTPLPSEDRQLARLRAEVGIVFQRFNLFAHKTVLDNVALAPVKVLKQNRRTAEQRAHELLDRVGIGSQSHRYPASCPADSNSGWPSPGPWPWTRR